MHEIKLRQNTKVLFLHSSKYNSIKGEFIMYYQIIVTLAILIAVLVGEFLTYRLIKNSISEYINTLNVKNNIEANDRINKTEYDEDKIMKHLDNIINSAIDEYELMNFTVEDVNYITTAQESEMLNILKEDIPKRISETLLSQLSLIYAEDYVPEMLAKLIYFSITRYVVDYNSGKEE